MTSQLKGAERLAELGGATYWRVEWIMRQVDHSQAEFYCRAADWPTTPAGQLATRDAEIATLRARVNELEQELASHAVPPVVAAAATGLSAPRQARGPEEESAPELAEGERDPRNNAHLRQACPVCGKKIWPRLLGQHLVDQHGGTEEEEADEDAPAVEAPPPPAASTASTSSAASSATPEPTPAAAVAEPVEAEPAEGWPHIAMRAPAQHAERDDWWRCRECGQNAFAPSLLDPSVCLRCVKQRAAA